MRVLVTVFPGYLETDQQKGKCNFRHCKLKEIQYMKLREAVMLRNI
jgi:hypothetical protein